MAAVPDAELAGALFAQYERGLYRFCLSRLRSREDAEDAVQATFVRAVRALERGVRPDVAPAWLFTIARNVCSSRRLAALRRARVETPRDLDHLGASALASEDEHPDELLGLREALAEMPPQLQRVVLLREWQGLSYREIGAELGVSQPAVETLLFRARRDLAKRLRGLIDLGPLFGVKALLGGATVAAVAVATVHPPRVAPAESPPVAPARTVVPHPSTLPPVAPVVRVARPAPVVHVRQVLPPPVVVRAVHAPVAAPRPALHHRASPAPTPVAAAKPSVVSPPPAPPAPSTPAAAQTDAPAPEPSAPAPAPAPAPSPAQPAPLAAPAVPVPAPVAAATQQPVDDVEQTAATVVSTATTAVPPAPTVTPVPSSTTLLGGG